MNKLIDLFQQMSILTKAKCLEDCTRMHLKGHIGSCCSPEYCEMAMDTAKEDYGIELIPTHHPTLPLMGEEGCVAAPHFRPLCTLHICEKSLVDIVFMDKYFELRDLISEESFKHNRS